MFVGCVCAALRPREHVPFTYYVAHLDGKINECRSAGVASARPNVCSLFIFMFILQN